MTQKLRVVGLIASKTGVTLITEKGESVELNCADYRTADIIEQVIPFLAIRKVAEVDVTTYDVYKEVEGKTKGSIKFFRVLKEKVKDIFGVSSERQIPQKYNDGMIREPVEHDVTVQQGVHTLTAQQKTILEESHISASSFDTVTTIVAVVDNTPIIGAEALKNHVITASKSKGRPVGFEKFMARLASVARERKHTAQELLVFLEGADLPIADDGCIVGYKALNVKEKDGVRTLYDHHTGNVPQVVGSVVTMPVEKVDDNRRVLCSNGLHIAARSYLGNFGTGGVVTLVKIAPEDVISVPLNENSKMRCSSYHIVAELPKSAHDLIKFNKPMTTEPEAAVILGNVIKGKHIGITEIVTINGPMGYDISVQKVSDVVPEVKFDVTVKANVLGKEKELEGNMIDVTALNKKVKYIQKTVKIEQAVAQKKVTNLDAARKLNANELKKLRNICGESDIVKMRAVRDVLEGKLSKRGAESKYNISARTIGRIIDKYALA